MTMTDFLFAADALRLEDGVGFHVETPKGRVPVRENVANKNAEAMSLLMGKMAGVQKKKGARR